MNTGAPWVGAPGGAPTQGASAPGDHKRAEVIYADLVAGIDRYDQELLDELDALGVHEDIDPPDDVLIHEALSRRLKNGGFLESVEVEPGYNELRLCRYLTRRQVAELEDISKRVRAWRIDPEASPPGWAATTLQKRERYLQAQRDVWGGDLL